MIRITKEFKFEMAHALHGYDGLYKIFMATLKSYG